MIPSIYVYNFFCRNDNIVSNSDSIVSKRENASVSSNLSDLGSELSACSDNESVGSNDSLCCDKDTIMMGVLSQVIQFGSGKKAPPMLDVVRSEEVILTHL